MLGREVKDKTGEVVAQVVNLLVDAAGEPRAAILDYGGFLGVGKRRIAVAWRALRFTPGATTGAVTLELDREQLKNFPEYKPDAPILAAVPPLEAEAPPAAGAPRQAPE
nr:PRC-barrel domain-containing protein [Roseicella aerolata]